MTKNDPHEWTRGRGRLGADPRCGFCARRQSDPLHSAPRPAAAPADPADVGPFLRVPDLRARYFPTVSAKLLRDWLSSGRLGVRPRKVGGMLLVDERALKAALARQDGGAA